MMYCVHCECGYLKILSIVIVSSPLLFSLSSSTLARWITNISPLFPDKYFPKLMMCRDDTDLWTPDWWLRDLSVTSVLDKYRVSLSLSHHPNIIITGWYRDTIRSHKTMQTQNNIFSAKLFCLFVWMFCTSVIGMQGTLWSVQQTIIYLRFNPVSDSEQDMRSSDQDLVNPQSSWSEHFPRAWHRVITRVAVEADIHRVITPCQMRGCQLPSV